MRQLAVVIGMTVGIAVSAAAAQPAPRTPSQGLPPGVNPDTGARPGNEIGTGSSWPLSDKSGNISPQDTTSEIAPNLPSPSIGENASVRDYLMAARSALLQGRTGEAQQSLEMAETRALDRSVPLFKTDVRSDNPLIGEIQQALQALGADDRARAVQIIEQALPHAGPQ
jgi:hypothetical protein